MLTESVVYLFSTKHINAIPTTVAESTETQSGAEVEGQWYYGAGEQIGCCGDLGSEGEWERSLEEYGK